MITEDYVSFETARLLKEKEFNGECARFYMPSGNGRWKYEHYHDFDISGRIECPTLQMAMKWLREVHKIYVDISIYVITKDMLKYNINVYHNKDREDSMYSGIHLTKECTKYEDACEVAIKYCLKNLI